MALRLLRTQNIVARLSLLLPLGFFVCACSTAQAADTLRVGHPMLEGAYLPLGTEVFESFVVEDGKRTPLNRNVQTISRETREGVESYVIHSDHTSDDGSRTATTITVRMNDFSLLHYRVKAAEDSASVAFSAGHIVGWVVLPDQPVLLIDREVPYRVFPVDGPSPWLVTALPLRLGLSVVTPRYSQWSNGEQWHSIIVNSQEAIAYNGRNVDCWVVDAGALGPPGYRRTLWIEISTNRILQGALRGEPGMIEYWSFAQ